MNTDLAFSGMRREFMPGTGAPHCIELCVGRHELPGLPRRAFGARLHEAFQGDSCRFGARGHSSAAVMLPSLLRVARDPRNLGEPLAIVRGSACACS